MRRLKTVRRPPIYPKTPGHLPCSSLTHPLPLSSRRPSVSFGGFGLNPGLDADLFPDFVFVATPVRSGSSRPGYIIYLRQKRGCRAPQNLACPLQSILRVIIEGFAFETGTCAMPARFFALQQQVFFNFQSTNSLIRVLEWHEVLGDRKRQVHARFKIRGIGSGATEQLYRQPASSCQGYQRWP